MTSPNPSGFNIDLAGVTAPITKLIECTSAAIGDIWEPHRIVRKAKADAEAAYILAKRQIEIDEVQWEAAQRLVEREARRQENRKSVAFKARAVLEETIDPGSGQPVDPDWVTDFFERVQDISSEQVQNLWAKILAGEIVRPGSYSLRTLETLRLLSTEEAKLFNNLSSFMWTSYTKIMPLIFSEEDEIYKSWGLDFKGRLALKTAGLIDLVSIGHATTVRNDSWIYMSYFGHEYKVFPPSVPYEFELGYVTLTNVGLELLAVAEPSPNSEIEEYMISHWQDRGLKVEVL